MNKILVNTSDLTIFKHELVTITIPAGSTKTQFYFPDLRNLRNTKLLGVEVWALGSKTPDGVPTASNAQLDETFITLENYGGKQFLKDCPAQAFKYNNAVLGTFEFFKKTFNRQRVNYPKSYILWNSGAPLVDTAVMLSVYYADVESEQEATFDTKR